ncbi:hypothetical protein ACN9NO_11515, partial [Glaesserella parasuis]|uniref:hypothetical protein n=1 Tax=Glaesserella parasuis TaxID=738 RepID=UPI003B21390D
AFPILHRASGWLAERAWAGLDSLARYLPLAPDPPFYLDFGETRLPLYLDLPGWDRLLRHLGLEWKEAPILREFLVTVRGVGWLNGLLYPPE